MEPRERRPGGARYSSGLPIAAQAMGREVSGRVSILDSDVLPVVAMAGTEIPSTMGSLGYAAPTGLEVGGSHSRIVLLGAAPSRFGPRVSLSIDLFIYLSIYRRVYLSIRFFRMCCSGLLRLLLKPCRKTCYGSLPCFTSSLGSNRQRFVSAGCSR